MLYPKVRLPSRFTVSRDVRIITESAETGVIKLFQVCRYHAPSCAAPHSCATFPGPRGEATPVCRWVDLAECLLISGSDGALARQGRYPAYSAGLRPVSTYLQSVALTSC